MRQRSALALIRTSISDDGKYLLLDAPDMPTVKVPLGVKVTDDNDVIRFRLWRLEAEGYNCGEEVASWLDKYLNSSDHKLVCYTPDLEPKRNFECPKWGSRASTHDQSIFQDLAQYHLFTLASLDKLNNKLENKVGVRNFRPNFVVEGVQEGFEEDNWRYVRIGDNVILRMTHLCGRCKQTTVDPETGVVNEEPLKTLKGFRCVDSSHPDHKGLAGAPAFGLNLNLEVSGTVAVGDTVYASY
ncbi:mitochondrial amidoxime reducing component 2-like isoform X2 [Amphiura filiformis]